MAGKSFVTLQKLLPQHGLSRLGGAITQSRRPWLKNFLINRFIKAYNINLDEALSADPNDYGCFNDFFVRELKPSCRPLAAEPEAIACPADGAISQMTSIASGQLIQAKGHHYRAATLLGSEEDAAPFCDGLFTTIYLSPRDYHRVHMPCAGTLTKTHYIPGELFSVNQATTEHLPGLFARNERLVCFFDSEYGPMAYVMVGAMMVAGIESSWHGHYRPNPDLMQVQRFDKGQIELQKGDELGRFRFGSTVILLFGKEAIQWLQTLTPGDSVRQGQLIGSGLASGH